MGFTMSLLDTPVPERTKRASLIFRNPRLSPLRQRLKLRRSSIRLAGSSKTFRAQSCRKNSDCERAADHAHPGPSRAGRVGSALQPAGSPRRGRTQLLNVELSLKARTIRRASRLSSFEGGDCEAPSLFGPSEAFDPKGDFRGLAARVCTGLTFLGIIPPK